MRARRVVMTMMRRCDDVGIRKMGGLQDHRDLAHRTAQDRSQRSIRSQVKGG
jgi:hypothetical protein